MKTLVLTDSGAGNLKKILGRVSTGELPVSEEEECFCNEVLSILDTA